MEYDAGVRVCIRPNAYVKKICNRQNRWIWIFFSNVGRAMVAASVHHPRGVERNDVPAGLVHTHTGLSDGIETRTVGAARRLASVSDDHDPREGTAGVARNLCEPIASDAGAPVGGVRFHRPASVRPFAELCGGTVAVGGGGGDSRATGNDLSAPGSHRAVRVRGGRTGVRKSVAGSPPESETTTIVGTPTRAVRGFVHAHRTNPRRWMCSWWITDGR